MKFATKPKWYYPSYLRHVATLPWEIRNSNFMQMSKKTQTNCILNRLNFVTHPQILIFSVFQIAILSPYWLQIKFSMSLCFTYLLMPSICGIGNSSQQTLLQWFFNNQHDIKRWGQDFDKKVGIWRGTQQRGWQTNFLRKAGQSLVLISYSKSCGTQAQLTGGQAAADRVVPALKKTLSFFFRSSHSLPLSLFCQLSGEVTENTFLSVKKTKSVVYCGNFWSRSLASCEQRSSRLSAPVHSTSWNISDASLYK